ncbi:MAG: hypothetical protein A3J28_08575 [Acidobacteria bacterium RIFCSPLOWO2_12_FULL_60_22]|nr:MAG: hypothetical protein A3J28_08575 [Acidobacteria bacterium RIFCSPLOWO2_12_FULL_60_22]
MRRIVWTFSLLSLAISAALAQDPVKVDPKHYKVEFENAQVRIMRVIRGPHEKSPLHEHPNYIAIYLTDGPGGRKAKTAQWRDAIKHEEENATDKATETVVVELKPTRAPGK